MVAANEPLIYQHVRRYFRKGVPAADILQAARLGFFWGIMKYDPAEGARLTTYALYWARNEAVDALQGEGSTIRLPRNVHEAIYRAGRANTPLDDDLAGAKRLLRHVSLDVPVGEGGLTRGEREPSSVPSPEVLLSARGAQERSKELVAKALTWLTARQREVIERHLLAAEPESFEAIGASLGVTKQGTEELQKRGKVKLAAALRQLMAPDDAVLWGGDLPAGPMRPRRAVAAPPPVAPADDEPPPASRVMAARRRRGKAPRPAAVALSAVPTDTAVASTTNGT